MKHKEQEGFMDPLASIQIRIQVFRLYRILNLLLPTFFSFGWPRLDDDSKTPINYIKMKNTNRGGEAFSFISQVILLVDHFRTVENQG